MRKLIAPFILFFALSTSAMDALFTKAIHEELISTITNHAKTGGIYDVIGCLKYNIENFGANINYQNNFGSPLSVAIIKKMHEVAEWLLENGANPNLQLDNESTALINAVYEGNISFIELLLKHKADLDLKSKNEETSALIAALTVSPKMVEFLLRQGANPNLRLKNGRTPLMIAAFNNIDLVKLLLQHGADPSLEDNNGRKAVSPHPEIRELLNSFARS